MVINAPPRTAAFQANGVEEPLAGIPRHVAIIMDGSGRWAEERGLSREAGHRAGTENLRRVIEAMAERHVKYLTLFAFSTENWSRPRREVNALIRLAGRVIDRELGELHANGVCLRHIGSLDGLPPDLQRRVRDAIELTKSNDRLVVTLAFNYGSRTEIIDAVRQIIADGVPADRVDEKLFASYLDTRSLPDPDLIVRTSGEMRISNFLLWQGAYAEYYFSPCYWPDFDEAEIDRALAAYGRRQRRFGGLNGHAQARARERLS